MGTERAWFRAGAAAALFVLGCNRPPEGPKNAITVVMTNKTGGHMNDFRLEDAGGSITYQIFSKDYTFRAPLEVTTEGPLELHYRRDGGERVDRTLTYRVSPRDVGGELAVVFGAGDQETFSFQLLPPLVPKGTLSENIEDARHWFDSISIDASAEEFSRTTGHTPRTTPKDGWAKDFGWSLKPEHVTLEVRFLGGRVARVELHHAERGPEKGATIAEKGITQADYDARQ